MSFGQVSVSCQNRQELIFSRTEYQCYNSLQKVFFVMACLRWSLQQVKERSCRVRKELLVFFSETCFVIVESLIQIILLLGLSAAYTNCYHIEFI